MRRVLGAFTTIIPTPSQAGPMRQKTEREREHKPAASPVQPSPGVAMLDPHGERAPGDPPRRRGLFGRLRRKLDGSERRTALELAERERALREQQAVELADLRLRLEASEDELKRWSEAVAALEDRLRKSEQVLVERVRRIRALEQDVAAAGAELVQARTALQDAELDLAAQRRRGDEVEQLADATRKLGEAAQSLAALQAGREQIERSLADVERASAERGEALTRLRKEAHERDAQLDELRAEVERLRRLNEPVDELRSKLAAAEAKLEGDNRTVGQLRRDRTGIADELERMRQLLRERERQLAALTATREASPATAAPENNPEPVAAHLLFVPNGAGYALHERRGAPPSPGETVVLEASDAATRFVVVKVGVSPLPADPRPCSYLLSLSSVRRSGSGR